jgi:hypothetical protein
VSEAGKPVVSLHASSETSLTGTGPSSETSRSLLGGFFDLFTTTSSKNPVLSSDPSGSVDKGVDKPIDISNSSVSFFLNSVGDSDLFNEYKEEIKTIHKCVYDDTTTKFPDDFEESAQIYGMAPLYPVVTYQISNAAKLTSRDLLLDGSFIDTSSDLTTALNLIHTMDDTMVNTNREKILESYTNVYMNLNTTVTKKIRDSMRKNIFSP